MLDSVQNGGNAVEINAASLPLFQSVDRYVFDPLFGVSSSDLTPSETDSAFGLALALMAQETKDPSFCKVHEGWRRTREGVELFPQSLTDAAFYIVRDPRDVAISLAHHFDVSIDQAVAEMEKEDFTLTPGGKRLFRTFPSLLFSWSRHVESWLDRSQLAPLLIKYESMLADPIACLRKACAHLGWTIEDSVLEAAVNQTSFQRLSKQEKEAGFSERAAPGRVFFRQGRAGEWRNTLSRIQAERIEKCHRAVMERLDYL